MRKVGGGGRAQLVVQRGGRGAQRVVRGRGRVCATGCAPGGVRNSLCLARGVCATACRTVCATACHAKKGTHEL